MIEFKNVSKVYGTGAPALDNVSLRIESGEFVFIVGASGAGKSTFLKLMTREEVPTSGSIRISERVLNDMRRSQIPYLRRELGIVFQDFRLISYMTVYDNVAFAMRAVGAAEKEVRQVVPFVLGLVDLLQKKERKPDELSGGEQQRVALARALANKPKILIADEPTGNVDPIMSREIVALLSRINDDGTTVVMVTHEHDLVRMFNKRVVLLDSGRVVSDSGVIAAKPKEEFCPSPGAQALLNSNGNRFKKDKDNKPKAGESQ
jgi:cell division transport system ATP-binding protein